MSAVAQINAHMENVQNIMKYYKEEHVAKCTDANNRIATHLMNEQKNTKDAAAHLAEMTQDFTDENDEANAQEDNANEANTALVAKNEELDKLKINICQVARLGSWYSSTNKWRQESFKAKVAEYMAEEAEVNTLMTTSALAKELKSQESCIQAFKSSITEISKTGEKVDAADPETDKVIAPICTVVVSMFQMEEQKFKLLKGKPWAAKFDIMYADSKNLRKWLDDLAYTPKWVKNSDEGYIAEFVQQQTEQRDPKVYKSFDLQTCEYNMKGAAAEPIGDAEPIGAGEVDDKL